MKKFLPLGIIGIVILAVVGFFIFKGASGNVDATLTPSEDMYWLKLNVSNINPQAESMEYELIYELPDGRVQGVPGTIDLEGKTSIERDILLGTESSGVYYYDEGVEEGTLSLRFFKGDSLLNEYESDWVLEDLKNDPKVF